MLTETQEQFLKAYQPEDRHTTSNTEIAQIANELNLNNASGSELQEIRNAVVRFYSALIKTTIDQNNGSHCDQSFNYSTALMSVTAVIDYYHYCPAHSV